MSIFKVLEANITKSHENYSHYLTNFSGDDLRGTEFMLFSLSNIFKDKSTEEIEVGITDSLYRGEKYDYGVDAIFITASKDLIEYPEEIDDYNEDTKFVIHLFQFKRGNGIAQADLLKFKTGIKKALIDESLKDTDNLYFYNRMNVLNEIKTKIFTQYSSDNISVQCHIVFGGIESNILSQSILTDELDNILKTLNDGGFRNCSTIITDCEKLIISQSKVDETVDIIEYQKTFNYITNTDEKNKLNGFVSVVKGIEIANLVKKHQTAIFEANIRDFYKRNDLNSKITTTSSDEKESKYFWSFNNGLTMTCTKVEEMPNNKYKLYNLQIVNGCQTSNAIYLALKNRERIEELDQKITAGLSLSKKEESEYDKKENVQFNDETSLLIKIIETKDDDLVYRITETTNSQTPIQAFSLKANDDVQKLIEQYLQNNDVSYERRINSLRNKGLKNIYSIQKLFQLFTAQILFKPSQVKNTPKTMFNSTYDSVFPPINVKVMNYALYLIPIKVDIAVNKAIIQYLKNNPNADSYVKTIISYGKLHLGCFVLSSILKKDYNEKGIVSKETYIIKELETNMNRHFQDALDNFEKVMKAYAGNKKESIPTSIRKSELDGRVVRYVKSRK